MGDSARLVAEAEVGVLLAEGRVADALAASRSWADGGIPNPAWEPWRSLRAGALAAAGRVAEADELLVEELRRARAWGGDRTTGRVLRALGELRGGSGLELLREAVDVLGRTEATVELARARLALGSSPDVTDEEAVPLLSAAADAAHLGGAERLRDEALAQLGRRGRTVVLPDGPERALTTTQRRVRELVGAGLDVRDVAQQLFLTPGTVLAVLDAGAGGRRAG